jgi:alanine racemase
MGQAFAFGQNRISARRTNRLPKPPDSSANVTGPKAQIDLGAIVANWRMLAGRAPSAQAAAVVKANAYGLGAEQVGRALANAGCRRFYVAWPHEGALLREALGSDPEIAVFHGPTKATLPVIIGDRLSPVLNSLDQIRLWVGAGAPVPAAVHVDTGMNRLGLSEADWPEAARLLEGATITHLASHLACSDEPGHPLNAAQLAAFQRARPFWPKAKRSLAATAGVYLGPDYAMDEIRPGIGLYGGGPTPASGPAPSPVLRLTAPILQLRQVAAGATTGYGATWASSAPAMLATLGLGYADGFLRAASNNGYGVVGGVKRPILGRVSMDLVMLDVTGLPVSVGDEVEFMGPAMTLEEQANAMSTIDYELLTRLGPRAIRTYVESE